MIKPQPEGQGKFNSEQVRSVVSRLHALVAEPAAVECNPPSDTQQREGTREVTAKSSQQRDPSVSGKGSQMTASR